jgi:hypothetical protein
MIINQLPSPLLIVYDPLVDQSLEMTLAFSNYDNIAQSFVKEAHTLAVLTRISSRSQSVVVGEKWTIGFS